MHGAGLLSALVLCVLHSTYGNSISEYVLVSQPHRGTVLVAEIDALSRTLLSEPRILIKRGLSKPMGLAVDRRRQRLFVADARSGKVFMYDWFLQPDGKIDVEKKRHIAVSGLAPHWVAVDEADGTVFCTDEARSRVIEVFGDDITRLSKPGPHSAKFHVLYSTDSTQAVDKPTGIAVDGSNIFWGNKAHGRRKGSIISGVEDANGRDVPGTITALSSNVDKVYGVCTSGSSVFYTGEKRYVYTARKGNHGHDTRALLYNLRSPRGCAWDGDGTIYVADQGGRAVYSFPSSSHNRGTSGWLHANKLFEVEEPYGIAVLHPSSSSQGTVSRLMSTNFLSSRDDNKNRKDSGKSVSMWISIAIIAMGVMSIGWAIAQTVKSRSAGDDETSKDWNTHTMGCIVMQCIGGLVSIGCGILFLATGESIF